MSKPTATTEQMAAFWIYSHFQLTMKVGLYGGPQLSRQIKIHSGKFKFTTANSNSPRQIQIRHGKFKFTTANLRFTAANSNSPRQIQRVC